MKKEAIKVLSLEHGKKVIKYLESLGGINSSGYLGKAIGYYYYINGWEKLARSSEIPKGYISTTLPTYQSYSLTF